MILPTHKSTLFPYTTLFRSFHVAGRTAGREKEETTFHSEYVDKCFTEWTLFQQKLKKRRGEKNNAGIQFLHRYPQNVAASEPRFVRWSCKGSSRWGK